MAACLNTTRSSFHDKQIAMAHGAGGEASRRLVEGLIRPCFANPVLEPCRTRRCWSRSPAGWP